MAGALRKDRRTLPTHKGARVTFVCPEAKGTGQGAETTASERQFWLRARGTGRSQPHTLPPTPDPAAKHGEIETNEQQDEERGQGEGQQTEGVTAEPEAEGSQAADTRPPTPGWGVPTRCGPERRGPAQPLQQRIWGDTSTFLSAPEPGCCLSPRQRAPGPQPCGGEWQAPPPSRPLHSRGTGRSLGATSGKTRGLAGCRI